MQISKSLAAVLAAAAIVAPFAVGQCGGNGGNADLVCDPLTLGNTTTVSLTGAPGQGFSLAYALNRNPNLIPGIGWLCVSLGDPTLTNLGQGVLPASGRFDLNVAIPNLPAFLNVVTYVQGAVADPAIAGGIAISPAFRGDFENADTYVGLPAMGQPHASGTTTVMGDGRVLLAGGGGGTVLGPVQSNVVEIYDPVTRTYASAPNMGSARAMHTGTTLFDGRVLVTGGMVDVTGAVTASCEIFDPWTNTWTAAAPMGSLRAAHNAVLLDDGRVLVVGGTTTFAIPAGTSDFSNILNSSHDSGEVYDPATDSWTPVANLMQSRRFLSTSVKLDDGRAFVMSGLNGGANVFGATIPSWTDTVDYYDPATNMFSPAPPILTSAARTVATSAVLDDGRVWLIGGAVSAFGVPTASSDTRLFDGTGWSVGPSLPTAMGLAGTVKLRNGGILVASGMTGTITTPSATDAAAVFDGTTLTPVANVPQARGAVGAVLLKDGSAFIAGGGDPAGVAQPDGWLYYPLP